MYKEAFYKMAADDDNGSFLGGAVTGTLGTLGAGTAAILANKKFGLLSKLLAKFKGSTIKDTPLKAVIKGKPLQGVPLKNLEGFKAHGFSDYLNSFDPRGIGFMDFLKDKGGITGKAKEIAQQPIRTKGLNSILMRRFSDGQTFKFNPYKDDPDKAVKLLGIMGKKYKHNSDDYKYIKNLMQNIETATRQ